MRVFDFNSAIVRTPGRSVVNGLRAGSGPAPVFDALAAEHQAYVAALREAGVAVTVLEALEDFPDSIFVEDPALVFTGAAILLRPGAPSRREEADLLTPTLQARFDRVLTLSEGFADGGDILITPRGVLIGLSARTDHTGAVALQTQLHAIGLSSEIVPVPPGTLHLKSDCSLIDEETVLATAGLAASGVLNGFRVIVAPPEERQAANALRVNESVFLRSDSPRTIELVAKHASNVKLLSVAEIAKIDAGLSCMSLRWFERR